MHTGTRVRSILESKRMKKKELIDMLGITRQGFDNKLKSGIFRTEELEIIAEYLGVRINDLLNVSQEVEVPVRGSGDSILNKIYEETRIMKDQLKLLSDQLMVKDQQISELIKLLGKLEVSPEMPPVREGAVVLPLHGKRGFVANSRANSCAMLIA